MMELQCLDVKHVAFCKQRFIWDDGRKCYMSSCKEYVPEKIEFPAFPILFRRTRKGDVPSCKHNKFNGTCGIAPPKEG